MTNPGFLLSQAQAQLLALALQRFYCADIKPVGEDEKGREEREMRKEALRGLRERPGEWDWTGLVSMAYGGIV
jgi:ATP synthase F1 complex assembly factor 1